MNDAEVYVTKELLLKGAMHIEEVRTELGIFRVRPLTDGEKARIDAAAVRGLKAHGRKEELHNFQVEVDLEQIVNNDWEIKFMILSYGLSVDRENPVTIDDVKKMCIPESVSQKLISEIRRVSGMGDVTGTLRRFRGEYTGPAVNDAHPDEWAAAGEDGG